MPIVTPRELRGFITLKKSGIIFSMLTGKYRIEEVTVPLSAKSTSGANNIKVNILVRIFKMFSIGSLVKRYVNMARDKKTEKKYIDACNKIPCHEKKYPVLFGLEKFSIKILMNIMQNMVAIILIKEKVSVSC